MCSNHVICESETCFTQSTKWFIFPNQMIHLLQPDVSPERDQLLQIWSALRTSWSKEILRRSRLIAMDMPSIRWAINSIMALATCWVNKKRGNPTARPFHDVDARGFGLSIFKFLFLQHTKYTKRRARGGSYFLRWHKMRPKKKKVRWESGV